MTQEESVPIGELQALVEKYEAMAEKMGPEEFTIAYSRVADELQAVIEDYE